MVLLLGGWVYSVVDAVRSGRAPQLARQIGAAPTPLSADAGPSTAFLLNAALTQLVSVSDYRGESGKLRVVIRQPGEEVELPDSLPGGVEVGYGPAEGADSTAAPTATGPNAPAEPGLWNVLLRVRNAIRPVPNLSLITLVPRSNVQGGRLGSYRLGSWPEKRGSTPRRRASSG